MGKQRFLMVKKLLWHVDLSPRGQ